MIASTHKKTRILEICDEKRGLDGPLLPILHSIQAECGCVDSDAELIIAEALNLTRAEVHGVVSFYHDFTTEIDERPEVQICRAEACQARGIEAMMADARVAAGEQVKLTTVYCLGLCSVGPNAKIGDTLYSRLDSRQLQHLIEAA